MNRQDAERITTEYLKPIYGFALKRCKNLQDAEDLSQEIVIKAFRALLKRDDIVDMNKFIWTIAHNTLSNYYRDSKQNYIGIGIDEIAEILCDKDYDIASNFVMRETTEKLQQEIAYLTKLQRRIVIAYYYENEKQSEIAVELNVPVGTVKWHLFEAKKDLKRGMDTMRKSGELKFNPIKFDMCGFSGSVGTEGSVTSFFRSALSQNITYCVLKEAKDVNEIADALGVSPVYVESEAEHLEKYGFLTKQGNKYLCNILLDEPSNELHHMHDEMYTKAAKLFANELYDELVKSDLLKSESILGGYHENMTMTDNGEIDVNFMLWALIPYIAALSGEAMMDKSISFEEAYTIRPDGGKNICHASVLAPNVKPPLYFESMKQFCGPCWNGLTDKFILWTIDSEWSDKRVTENYQSRIVRDLSLLDHYLNDDLLTDEEYSYLVEHGYIKILGNPEENFKTSLQILYIKDEETRKQLLLMGNRIKEKYKAEFDALKAPYIKAVLDATPTQLYKIRKYVLQHIFYSDSWFILHCLKVLVNNGKLKLPTKEQKKSLTTLIVPNK